MADIGYDPLSDDWSLVYTTYWRDNPAAFGLSPALPVQQQQAGGSDSRSVRRFIENLLPEGRALDIAASAQDAARIKSIYL